jgi:hypothetical protein
VTEEQLALRARIFAGFAETAAPPDLPDTPDLRALADQHVVVLDEAGRIAAAHPFAAEGPHTTTVRAGDRAWFGSCAWDGLGIAAALGLEGAHVVDAGGVDAHEAAFFHVAVPARQWWDDIAFT